MMFRQIRKVHKYRVNLVIGYATTLVLDLKYEI